MATRMGRPKLRWLQDIWVPKGRWQRIDTVKNETGSWRLCSWMSEVEAQCGSRQAKVNRDPHAHPHVECPQRPLLDGPSTAAHPWADPRTHKY